MSVTKRENELVAVGVSVAAGCKPCTDYHLNAVREIGASEDEITYAIRLGAQVRKQAAEVMGAFALNEESKPQTQRAPSTRLDLLISIAAAYAVNSTDELERYLTEAETTGVAEIDIKSVVKLAGFIRGKAISHVEKLVELDPPEENLEEKSDPAVLWAGMMKGGCGCGDSQPTQAKEG